MFAVRQATIQKFVNIVTQRLENHPIIEVQQLPSRGSAEECLTSNAFRRKQRILAVQASMGAYSAVFVTIQ